MGDHSIIDAWSKTVAEPEAPSTFDAFDAYCQDNTREEFDEVAPAVDFLADAAGTDSQVGSAKGQERKGKRRRSEDEEMAVKNEQVEEVIKEEDYDVNALYLVGAPEEEAVIEPEDESSTKRRKISPTRDAPRVERQAGLSAYQLSSGQAIYHFGPIPGIEVGAEFDSRDQARLANVHRASIKGIVGSQDVGCSSICVNGGYEDNEDTGYTIVYSGDGGKSPTQDEAGADQMWSPANKALFKSFKDHRAVRVLRGHKSKGKCAPASGYRYDGLYQILRCWISRSVSFGHYKTIKFAMQRLPKQDPITKLDQTFPEPDFVLNDLSGDWIVMPKHYHLIGQRDPLPEPSLIHFDDEFGEMTPAELAKVRRKSKKAKIKAANHSAVKREHSRRESKPEMESLSPVKKEETRFGRVFKSLEEEGPEIRPPGYFRPVNVIHDQFGNVMQPTSPVLQQGPPEAVIQNVEFHKNVNKEVYKKIFPDADPKHPTRGYMRWRQRCFADQKVHDNLDALEA